MLDLSPALLLTTAVVFLVMLVALNKILYVPLLSFIKNRDEAIKNDLQNANRNQNDIEAYNSEVLRIISEAKVQAGKLREEALSQAKEEAQKEIESIKNSQEIVLAKFLEDLSAQKESLKESLKANLPAFRDGVKSKIAGI